MRHHWSTPVRILAAISCVFGATDIRAAAGCYATFILQPKIRIDVHNHDLFQRAPRYIPGGVNSPVRAFKTVGGEPFFTEHADGAYCRTSTAALHRLRRLVGADDRRPRPSGRARSRGRGGACAGLSFGTPCAGRGDAWPKTICGSCPRSRWCAWSTPAPRRRWPRSALARGFTGRDKIVKFEGCYHGHADSLLVKAGSGALTFGVPTSPGVPAALADLTLTLPYNDLDAANALFAQARARDRLRDRRAGRRQHELRPAAPGFLQGLRDLCTQPRRAADLRRSDDRLSRRARRRASSLRHQAGPDARSARSSAAACRWAPTAAGARSWTDRAGGPVYQAGTLSRQSGRDGGGTGDAAT